MYLKHLEMVGFKSFAHKTKLEFETGMTAVVGPNGCGKSNVSDAIKWVLGEQSAKALRGSKMEDCIFNGTDKAKPMSMAEVGITFADCENTLDTEYNEITVTRRVFRSGEGQYFINKTPCRLKDIQRLFMDTGIGTSSYSFMEQGRIDRILSSRPEDRRTIFEEASGITKFKADKKEAIRKLEHTEANLLRLADVIREVKRQIGSLQRQAGKARRYKTLKTELRQYDIFATRQRLLATDKDIERILQDISTLDAHLKTAHQEIEELETGSAVLRESLVQTEREIGSIKEAGVQAQSKLDHTHDLINTNKQRIEEYRDWSSRDSREIEEIKKSLEQTQKDLTELTEQDKEQQNEQEQARETLKKSNDNLEQHQQQIDSARTQIHELREKSFQLEGLASRLQNQLIEIEASERSSVIQKERLAAEKSQLTRVSTTYDERQSEITTVLEQMKVESEKCRNDLTDLEATRTAKTQEAKELQHKRTNLSSDAAAMRAQIDLLNDSEASREGFSDGSRALLDSPDQLDINPANIFGDLASALDVEQEYRLAVGATLNGRLNAVIVSDTTAAIEILHKLQSSGKGATSLLAVDTKGLETNITASTEPTGDRLIDHVKCSDSVMPLLRRLIGNVLVTDTLQNIPSPVPLELAYVTKKGSLVCGDGCAELWSADAGTADPLARKHLLADNRNSLTEITADIGKHNSATIKVEDEISALNSAVKDTRVQLDTKNRALAQKEGEAQIISSEATEARERLETVTWELSNLLNQKESGDSNKQTISLRINETQDQREALSTDINSRTHELRDLETRHSDLHAEVTEHRVHFAALSQKLENLQHRRDASAVRAKELATTISGRSSGIESYTASITKLTDAISTAENNLTSLKESVADTTLKVEGLTKNRGKQSSELQQMEDMLGNKRELLEEKRNIKSDLDIQSAESRMRRQNQVDRITSEYSITIEQMSEEQEPEWTDQQPSLETIEITVTELQTKLKAMGAVNLVAIEEYKELEERYTFLVEQESDLTKSKQLLMDMIRKINRTTSEMFQTTFEKVNDNFQSMFKKLFNGGSAKLVLVNEEDVLECGIEIIARPPGKRLQNVSLLSGGERTLTAVSLLFAIYMIKPSPFCLLDELDAALDDTNIGRFVNILKEFLQHSQFLVITHNRQTIAAANILYGVTMPEHGISKLVSVKFNEDETADTNEPVLTA